MTTGQILRQARESAALSQLEVDRRAGLRAGKTNRYEQDHREPSVATAVRLCRALGVSMDIFDELQVVAGK